MIYNNNDDNNIRNNENLVVYRGGPVKLKLIMCENTCCSVLEVINVNAHELFLS